MLLAVVAGSALAAWLAVRTGTALAAARYGEALAAAHAGTVVTQPPRLDSGWVLIAQPFGAALAYLAAAAGNAAATWAASCSRQLAQNRRRRSKLVVLFEGGK